MKFLLQSLVDLDLQKVISESFAIPGSPERISLSQLLYDKNIIHYDVFCSWMYGKLVNDDCFMIGNEWKHNIIKLLRYLNDHQHLDILQHISNATCKIPNRSLITEVNAYFNRRQSESKLQLE